MNLSTITMDRTEARKAVAEYRRAVKERHSAEDEAILRGYRALVHGHQLLQLTDAISRGGVDELGLPTLAVMRADVQWCFVSRDGGGSVTFASRSYPHHRLRSGVYRFPIGTLRERQFPQWRDWNYGRRAIVPSIPPGLRPAHSLANYEVLWEATWDVAPRPPGDPALLKHITGDLYAVLAMWDLTPLEQAVLGARAFQ